MTNIKHQTVKPKMWLKYKDLVERGLFTNRVTLNRWVKRGIFPAPIRLSEFTVAWPLDEVLRWEESKRLARAQQNDLLKK